MIPLVRAEEVGSGADVAASRRRSLRFGQLALGPHLAAALILAAAVGLMDAPLAFGGRVLASYDAQVYFYPHAAYLAARLAAGQIALWDPYLFGGVPFLANSQVGALYPPNWLYLAGSVSRVYAGLVVLHTWWLGLGVYVLARNSLRLRWAGALVAGLAVAGSGYVGGMVGHLNQLEALSWAPYAILGVERAAARQSWRWALGAAEAFALMILAGHTQVVYIVGLAAGLAGASRLAELAWAERRFAGVPLQVARLAAGPALGALIAAPQLLPTLELTRLGLRSGGLDFPDAAAFSFPPPFALIGLLPTIGEAPPSTEWLGYVGLTALLLAGLAVWRRPAPLTFAIAGFALAGLLLALGQYTPLYHLAFRLLPGFDLFRVPARWLAWWVLGVALLAGMGMDWLTTVSTAKGFRHHGGESRSLSATKMALNSLPKGGVALNSLPQGEREFRGPRVQDPASVGHGPSRDDVRTRRTGLAAALAVLVVVLTAFAFHDRRLIHWPAILTVVMWVTTVGAFGGLARATRTWRLAGVGIVGLLVAEITVAAGHLPVADAIWPSAVEQPGPVVAHLLAQGSTDRILTLGDNSYDPGDITSLRAMLAPTLSPNGVASYLTALKITTGLVPNVPLEFEIRTIDGYDGGLLPLGRFTLLKQIFPVQGKVIEDGRLRLQLLDAPDPRLLGWLNVRYLVMDRLRDQWINGVYYDLGVRQTLAPGESVDLPVDPAFSATSLGIGLASSDGGLPNGRLLIRASGAPAAATTSLDAASARNLPTDLDRGGVWLARANFDHPSVVDTVRVTWNGSAPVTLRTLSLVDDRIDRSVPVVVNPEYHLDYLGDLKVYRDEVTLPRAFLANGLALVANPNAEVATLREPGWNARARAVAVAGEVAPGLAFTASGDPGAARIVADDPERVVVDTDASGPRALVLTDAFYPGWQATIDGKPAPILPVDLLFRGVLLPSGAHEVVFTFAPTSWRLGLALGALGVVTLVVGLVKARR